MYRALSQALYHLPTRPLFSESLLNGTDLLGQVEVSQSPNLFHMEKKIVVVKNELYASVNDIMTINFTNHLQCMKNVLWSLI
jgi:hypothetical protein